MTYEYACQACGHAWEAEQPISAAPLTDCPSCHKATAKRQVSGGAGFILKGGGWYSDLYASKKPGKDESSPAAESKDSKDSNTGEKANATTTKSDSSKPAEKVSPATTTSTSPAPGA
jgi:putative FmdB family regulatory protein